MRGRAHVRGEEVPHGEGGDGVSGGVQGDLHHAPGAALRRGHQEEVPEEAWGNVWRCAEASLLQSPKGILQDGADAIMQRCPKGMAFPPFHVLLKSTLYVDV